MASVILIVGAPRSGTTWLAKIIDSHPDVLYRHEPDEIFRAPTDIEDAGIPALLHRWIAGWHTRSVAKPPFFSKSWQVAGARGLRSVVALGVRAAGRLPRPLNALARLRIPDFIARPVPRVAIKSVRWIDGAAVLARLLPASRTIFILRHPCGQVNSVMRGQAQRRFDLRSATMPFDEESTVRFAEARGVGDPAFQALPDAAKYAWAWRAFNEPAYEALAPLSNVRIVIYEALCTEPEALSRDILAFSDLGWNGQTGAFIARSTGRPGATDYFGVLRDALVAAEAWRHSMSEADRRAVGAVMAASPLARFWPDLLAAAG